MTKTVITFINTRNNETFVSAEEQINVSLDGSMTPVMHLKREDGSEKTVAMSTFKRYYKEVKTEIEVEEPKGETKPMTKHQKAALRNIKGAYNDYIGGLENSVQDGQLDEMPPIDELFSGVYVEAMSTSFQMMGGLSVVGGPAPICMRFAGKQFIREQIAKLFRKDGYEVPEDLIQVPDKKSGKGHSQVADGERINLRNDEADKMVTVRAFTGMLIGSFEIEEETNSTITVTTAKGLMEFDKVTGLQTNANNPRYANRIEF